MTTSIFGQTPYPIRADLDAATRKAWPLLGRAGTWWTGAERAALVAEVRAARDCRYCAERKAAVSPYAVQGKHSTATELPDVVIQAVHWLTTDAARLSEKALREFEQAELGDAPYVEIVGVVSTVLGIDSFCDALGLPLLALPDAQAGEPTRYRPAEAVPDVAWVPMIPRGGHGPNEADLFPGKFVANVVRAMSLVPDAVRNLRSLGGAFYFTDLTDFNLKKSLERPQIELIASRVSALNECFY